MINTWGLLLVFVAVIYFWRKRKVHPKFPDGPVGFPLVGCLPFLGKHPHKAIKRWGEMYGPIMSVQFGYRPIVMLNNYEMAHQVFVRQGAHFSERALNEVYCSRSGYGGMVMNLFDDEHKAQKKFGLKVLQGIGVGRMSLDKIVYDESNKLMTFLKTKTHQPFSFKDTIYKATSNVISKMIISKRSPFEEEEHDLLRKTRELFTDPGHYGEMLLLVMLFDRLRFIPPFSGAFSRFDERFAAIADHMKKEIEAHQNRFDKDNLKDYVDAYIHEQKFGKEPVHESFTDVQLSYTLRDLMVAGTDTSSASLSWMILTLLHHPEYQEAIAQEINKSIGRDEAIIMDCRGDLPFTCAFIQEAQRYFTITPLGLDHLPKEDTKVGEFFIPANTSVIANLWAIHNDETIWPRPQNFDPYRHLDENDQFVPSKKIIPFSIGPRSCFGKNLARTELFIFLVDVIRNFSISLVGKDLPPLDDGINSFVYSPNPYQVILRERC